MTITTDLLEATHAWIAADPDPAARAELNELIASGDGEELAERMAGALEFGTAGIRGKVEAGSNRMNRAVVIRTTAGLAAYVRRHGSAGPVVVGRDARLSSARFMTDTVGVLAAAGLPVVFFPHPVPTPLVAHAALRHKAAAAIVITASHNPPQDNGYKVYAANGAQIVPPVDVEIAAAIADVGPAVDVPRIEDPYEHEAVAEIEADFFARYLDDLQRMREGDPPADPVAVYSPMHGVGGRFVVEALQRSGYTNVHPVAEQFSPDGHFPTVDFPNPEEPGALDLAIAQARRLDADLIVANDPDTDRLAAAVPDRHGAWRPLTGNQIGVLLADHLLSRTQLDQPIVLSSIVSTPMLRSIADAYGATYATTLTGFKWIWNAALDLQEEGKGTYLFGFEEALGYSVGPAVRDKDGISATVHFLDLVASAQADGLTVLDRLEGLAEHHGLWVSVQHSVVRPGTEGAAEIAAAMKRLAADPPATVAGVDVTAVTDYRTGAESRPRYLGATSLVELDLGHLGRILVRPSGTEPKLKLYVDLTVPLAGQTMAELEPVLLREATAAAEELAAYLEL